MTDILETYHEEGGENTEVDDRKMRVRPVGKGKFAHGRNILHEIVYAMTQNSGKHCEEGEEEGGPVGDVGDEEVVDMDTSLGGKEKVHQEYEGQHAECKDWFE